MNTATIKASATRASFDTVEAMLIRAWPVVVASIFALQTALILIHQPFADEWQALQIAVQSPDLASLFDNLHYESHPPLWYLYLRALAALVGPYRALAVGALIAGLATQAVILLTSPMPRWVRLCTALSAPILFDFITVSRGHTLGLLLVFATLALWERQRAPWLAIALLPLVDFFYGVFSLFLIFLRWRERKLDRAGLALWLLLSMLAAWSVLPAEDYIPIYARSEATLPNISLALARFSIVYLPIQGSFAQMAWGNNLPDILFMTLWAPLLLTMGELTRGRRDDQIVLFGLAVCCLAFYVFAFPLGNRHLFIVTLMLLVVIWRQSAAGARPERRLAVAIWLVLGAVCGIWSAWFGLTQSFDRSREVASYIRAEGLAEEHWVAVPEMVGQGVSGLTGIGFEKPGKACMQQFVRWNSDPKMRWEEVVRPWVMQMQQKRGRFYILSNKTLAGLAGVEPVRTFARSLGADPVTIWVVNRDRPLARLALPDCVPGLRPLADTPAI